MSIKILLADDSITIQKVVGIIFGGEEYSLTVVDNGKAAVEKAQELDPDVLLIDALMPGMSGYEVCEAIRSNPALATKPILLLTGSFEPFDENKAKTCGADDFIAKPFESQQIVSKVKELFDLGKGRASAPAQAPETIIAPVIETTPVPPPAFAEPELTFPETQPPAFTQETSPFESTSFAPEPAVTAPATATPAIWDAFTPEEPAVAAEKTTQATGLSMPGDDVFAMVQEEPEPAAVQPPAVDSTPHPHVDSQWIPVEEQSFEFQEEEVAELPPAVFDEPAPVAEKIAFDESAFEPVNTPVFEQAASFGDLPAAAFDEPAPARTEATDLTTSPFETSYQEPVEPIAAEVSAPFTETAFESIPPAAVQPATGIAAPAAAFAVMETASATVEEITPAIAAPTATAAPATLTEEQLRAALATVSKDVIERIVWEVVPDLAEVLIKEAIRKIKNGL